MSPVVSAWVGTANQSGHSRATTTYRVAAGEEPKSRGAEFATVGAILMGSFAFRFDSPASVDSIKEASLARLLFL